MESSDTTNELVFYVNNQRVVLRDVDPRTLLLDYLRSDEVGLTGTKKVCGQGGCGACTVTLHRYNERTRRVENLAVNSCLRPLCSLDGMAITTVEGVGSVETEVSPVQHCLAVNNGTQCGYCTPGWVMSMHSYLVEHPDKQLTQREIEELFDGNLCRCTGFRPILYAMRHFAADFGPQDEQGCMKCVLDPKMAPRVASSEPNQVPPGIQQPPRPLAIERDGYYWYRPLTLDALMDILREHGSADDLKLIVGNTSIGVYGEPAQGVTMGPPHIRVDISHIPELYGFEVGDGGLTVGAATSYTDLLDALGELLQRAPEEQRSGLEALHYMTRRTAGRIIRDAASLAGNTMLVVRHVREGAPFPSDMFTALCTMGASVDVLCPGWSGPRTMPILDFADAWQDDDDLQKSGVILRYHIPLTGTSEWARTYKVALREVNAHAIVNGGFRVALDRGRVISATAVLGGVGPLAFHVTELETWLVDRPWDGDTLAGALPLVRRAVLGQLEATRARMRDVPDEGFTDAYRVHLAETYFYQFFVWVAEQVEPGLVSREVWSAGTRPERPISRGTQSIQTYEDEYPVSLPLVKVEAFIQTTGEAKYTHDYPRPSGGLDGALVVSTSPLAQSFSFAIPEEGGPRKVSTAELCEYLRARFPGVVDLVTAADIPGKNQQQYTGPADPLLCPPDQGVSACGQALAVVLADEQQQAVNAAWWVQTCCVVYEPYTGPDGQPVPPVLRLHDAIDKDLVLEQAGNIKSIIRPGSAFDWVATDEAVVDGVHCRVVRGSQESISPQIHFYMETQSALAFPGEPGPTSRSMTVVTSTQNPGTVQSSVMAALNLPSNHVQVEIKRLGGGYGGKGPRTPWCATIAAVAAAKHRRPVRLDVTRETDSALFGHSNPLLGRYAIAIGTGQDNPDNRGRIMGLSTDFWLNAGNTADCSPIVMDCVQLRADNAYYVPNYQTTGRVCITNTISNTSFRTLEALSGIIVHEDAVEAAAHAIGMLPEDVREKNLYAVGNFTPYGQELGYCYMSDVWSYTKRSWQDARHPLSFEERVAAIAAFNAENRWRKRGISLIPVKYGMGFNLASMERGDALVDIYTDGTVLVRHGGVEMGQGLNTQVTQLVAQALGVPLSVVQIGTTSTAVIPNPTSTGASTGTAFNGGAAQKGARLLRHRLEDFCMKMLREKGRAWCSEQNIDFWSYDDGWRHPVSTDGGQPTALVWNHVIQLASQYRVNLSVQAQHDETGGTREDTGLHFWAPDRTETVQNFVGFTYSAGISEVEVDVLTGEVTILRSDLVYDMGKSLNPATDVGQIEGSFVQGIGRVLTEEIVWQEQGSGLGMNNTPNTWGYKVPATVTIPLEMNINLYPRELSAEVPENPNLLMSAKESGEPPMCLAASVYFAVKHAIQAARRDRGVDGWFRLDLPCTVQRVREACLIDIEHMTLGS